MALFEAGHTVERDTLLQYLPQGAGNYKPVKREDPHSYEREREMLFGMILKLQHEIDQLKQGSAPSGGIGISEALPPGKQIGTGQEMTLGDGLHYRPVGELGTTPHPAQSGDPVDVPYSTVDHWEGLSLEDTERETIRLALQRNEGRRKPTAAELHISERTLYRKIKEYGLE